MTTTKQLLEGLKKQEVVFKDVIAHIDLIQQHTPTAFINGNQRNEKNENQGSARVLIFAQSENLDKEDTLLLFAEHYQNVLNTPEGNDHQNIRQFMINGWQGVIFEK